MMIFPAEHLLPSTRGPVDDASYHWGQSQIIDNQGILRAQISGTTIYEHMQDSFIHAAIDFST